MDAESVIAQYMDTQMSVGGAVRQADRGQGYIAHVNFLCGYYGAHEANSFCHEALFCLHSVYGNFEFLSVDTPESGQQKSDYKVFRRSTSTSTRSSID